MIGNYAFKETKIISTEQFKFHNITNAQEIIQKGDYFILNSTVGGITCWFKNSQLIQIGAEWLSDTNWSSLRVTNVYGIK